MLTRRFIPSAVPDAQALAHQPASPPSCRPQHPSGGFRRIAGALLLGLLALAPLGARAQSYQLHQWTNFENGTMPGDAFAIGHNFSKRARVVEYASLTDAPPGLTDPQALKEVGRFGLALQANDPGNTKGSPLIGLAVGVVLGRSQLGEKGRALFQADFYVPPKTERFPALAVLALNPLKGPSEEIRQFYRFGSTLDRHIYFSYIPERANETVNFYKYTGTMLPRIPRGKWHRFAIVCQGPSTIRCYIDGIEMPFSPVTEASLQDLQVGICLAEAKGSTYELYVDNLSVQFSPDDAPLPISPWLASWPQELAVKASAPPNEKPAENPDVAAKKKAANGGVAAAEPTPLEFAPAPPAPKATSGTRTPPSGGGTLVAYSPFGTDSDSTSAGPDSIQWLDTTDGWNRASSTGKPMLVAFVAPNIRSCRNFDQVTRTDPAAKSFINRHVPILIDVNQLQGGDLAKKFGVFKVPTVVLLNAQGGITAKTPVGAEETWPTIESRLTSGATR